jgi:O-antigen ligase
VMGGAEVVRKHQRDMAEQNVLAFRDGIWRMALAGFERYPAFGVGMDNFKLITQERVKAWRVEAGKDFEAKRYASFPHAHSIYLNTLAERGLVGFVPLIAVMVLWAVFLVRYRPRPEYTDEEWLLWGCAASAWIITFGAGLVNTTLHHEHGILAALFLGAWLSTLPARRAS